ncbi:MAG: acylaminoacyl-peptidase [Bacteroidetes bacterium CG12_big_fil_rev_8_21_14_0_65_60_17]|nr:MAG: acylaminoacyl-peptidase [Bacteroidetes bacterium CG12_big_fil_rev_8_21_14_0_65_60_17]
MNARFSLFALAAMLLTLSPEANAQSRRAMDHEDVNAWRHITDRLLSPDGAWAVWVDAPEEGDPVLHIQSTDGNGRLDIAFGNDPAFVGDYGALAFRMQAPFDSTRQAKLEERKEEDLPADSLALVDLSTLRTSILGSLAAFKVPERRGSRIAWTVAERDAVDDSTSADSTLSDDIPDKKEGTTLVVADLASGSRHEIHHVTDWVFSEDGQRLVLTRQSKDGLIDGIYDFPAGVDEPVAVDQRPGQFGSFALSKDGAQLAWLTNAASWPAEQPEMRLRLLSTGQPMQEIDTAFLPDNWWVSEHGSVRFSESGARLFFGTSPVPVPEPDHSDLLDSETVELDVWSWTDPLLQPMQLVQRKSELERTYDAVYFLESGVSRQLETEDMPVVSVSLKGDGEWGLGESNLPYRQEISWDSPRYMDAWAVHVETGERTAVFEGLQSNASLSPGGSWITWWDGAEEAWFAYGTSSGEVVNLSAALPYRVTNPLHDWPMLPSSEGSAGWSEDDGLFLMYDPHDVWAVDPDQPAEPRSLTEGTGRELGMRFRVVDLDPDNPWVESEFYLSAFHYDTKQTGYWRDRIRGSRQPEELISGEARYSRLERARQNRDVFMYSRETFSQYPEISLSGPNLTNARVVSTTNPQQADFFWGSGQLVQWTSLDGLLLDGILYTPEGFDPDREYPMMVYFYEKNSEGLFNYYAPRASRSIIDRAFYVSRGYLLFVPDIPYKVGYPGESAMNAVMPGVTHLIAQGFVDADRIGVQGHSWGGYQIAHMVTRTNLFAAAEAGAPVVNMTSAYGGIRWASGMSRMFQYERTQSRIGGTLWNAQQTYILNSPLFYADKVETPLLMMHNDEDGAVPWYQGIEYFVALRRLGKPVWMLNYNGEAHGLQNLHNKRDFSIRMQQFFDHYLMDAPAPVWLAEGIPAVKKGHTLGLEPAGGK